MDETYVSARAFKGKLLSSTCAAVYYAVQGGSNFFKYVDETLLYGQSNSSHSVTGSYDSVHYS